MFLYSFLLLLIYPFFSFINSLNFQQSTNNHEMFHQRLISSKIPTTLCSILKRWYRPVGIVGLPNVGKSTLFNALTKSELAEMANYPFCTIEPNKADILFVFDCY